MVDGYWRRQVYTYHPVIGWWHLPNLYARLELGGTYHNLMTNSAGMRSSREYPLQRLEGRKRIVFLGDSYAAGDGVSNGDRFTDLLEKRHPHLDAMNFGLNGSGTDQQLLVFETLASHYEADAYVFCICVENIARNLYTCFPSYNFKEHLVVYRPKPYFELHAGELVLKNQPVPVEKRTKDDLGEWQCSFPYLPGSSDPYAIYSFRERPHWQLMRAIVERFLDQANGKPVFIVPMPMSDHYLELQPPTYGPRFQELEDAAQNVFLVDLLPAFKRFPMEARKGFRFPDDPHYTAAAHVVVADALESAFLRHCPWLLDGDPALVEPSTATPARTPMPVTLGISAFYHDAAAAIVRDGAVIAAAQEERFSRKKGDASFPVSAIAYCLEEARLRVDQLDSVVFYDKPGLTFDRLLESFASVAPRGHELWLKAMPHWLTEKFRIPQTIRTSLQESAFNHVPSNNYRGPIFFTPHHLAHAAAAFFPSPFEEAAILTLDGVGEWATASIGFGRGSEVEITHEMRFPDSLGLLYSAFTYFCGFKVNSGEYKLMGLAPYGTPCYLEVIKDKIASIREDGTVHLNLEYFGFLDRLEMTAEPFEKLFGGPRRQPESRITRREMDLAASIQAFTEEAVMKMADFAYSETRQKNLCLAGGVALNCVANGRLLREGPFENIWIQPAAGDAGSALGAALAIQHGYHKVSRPRCNSLDRQQGSYLGPALSEHEVEAWLRANLAKFHYLRPEDRAERVAEALAQGKILGFFSGRMEFGPRSLGARSILGDPRRADTQRIMNLRIKYRESFRPFAPAVLAEDASKYFEINCPSPYMLLVAPVRKERQLPRHAEICSNDDLLSAVNQVRSDIPAVTHWDYSARIQTVHKETNPLFYEVLTRFKEKTGVSVLVNTSFNVRGEPIVCTPEDAYRCFMRTEMDCLYMEGYWLERAEQPKVQADETWREEFALD